MHFYNNTRRIPNDRPQGVNIPRSRRRTIKCISGDTLTFTANVVLPSTQDPVRTTDLEFTDIYVAVAENRFSPIIWAGSIHNRWLVLDEYRPGLLHITVPRTVMGALRRGSYMFSVVVDDGIVRETQLTGNFQIEYEPTGSINDIPYRNDQDSGDPISLTPEIDMAAQKNRRMTYDQLISAVDTISAVLIKHDKLSTLVFEGCDHEPTEDELDEAVHRLSRLIIWDDKLRVRIPDMTCDSVFDPTYDEFVERVCLLMREGGLGWRPVSCRPVIGK